MVAKLQNTQGLGQPLRPQKWWGRPFSSRALASFQNCLCWALQGTGVEASTPVPSLAMTDGILGKAATMEIPIHGNGEAGQLPEDDGLEQVLLFDSSCFNFGIPTYKPWALTLFQ